MNSPNVTVIIPAYNCAEFLYAAVESVRWQSYQDLELIVVDDGSTDATLEKARELSAGWPKMRVIHVEHGGLARARNRALEEAAGQWIALLDADDCWQPEKLQKCMDYLAAHPDLSVVYHPMSTIRADGKPLRERGRRCRQGWITEPLFHHSFVHDPSAVFHKRVIETCGPFDQSLPVAIGYEFWLRVSQRFEFGLVNEPLGLRRRHDRNLDKMDLARTFRIRSEILERFYFDRDGRAAMHRRYRAAARLARARYQAALQLLSVKQYREAMHYLRKAVRLCPLYVKSYPVLIHASVLTLIFKK